MTWLVDKEVANYYKDITMSLLASYLARHLIPALEAAFVAHEPAMQAALLSEVQTLADHVVTWIDEKVAHRRELKE